MDRLAALSRQLAPRSSAVELSAAATAVPPSREPSRTLRAAAAPGQAAGAPERRVRLALMGCGQISHAHLAGIQALCGEVLEVSVVIDSVAARAEELAALVVGGGGRAPLVFSSLDEALAAEDVAALEDSADLPFFDAVDVMLPHQLHLPVTRLCLERRKHALLEKPLAPTLAEAEEILRLAEAAAERDGTVLMVAENSQYWPEVQRGVELIESGAIGEILSAKASFNMRKSRANYMQQGTNEGPGTGGFRGPDGEDADVPWRYDLAVAGGGIVIDGGAHWLRPMRCFMGEIERVVGVTAQLVPDMQGESMAQALLEFKSGRVGYFEAMAGEDLHLGPGGRQGWRIVGSHGEITITG